MKITQEQLDKIAKYLPKQRGNVKCSDLDVINAVLYVVENGCKWRSLPKEFGNWHTIYVRMSRWSKNHVLDRIFAGLQSEGVIFAGRENILPRQHDRESPQGCGRRAKKNGPQSIGRSKGGLTTKIHMVSASDRAGVAFCLTGGNVHDSIGGGLLVSLFPQCEGERHLVMDRAYEGGKMCRIAEQKGFTVVVPPKSNRKNPWD